MKNWFSLHLGLLAFIIAYAIIWYHPIQDGGILPDPWETLFDWAGEVVAYSYIAILISLINLAPGALLAGLLDRCRWWHTPSAIFLIVISFCVIFHNSFSPLLAGICGVITGALLTFIYMAARQLRDGMLRLARKPVQISTALPAREVRRS